MAVVFSTVLEYAKLDDQQQISPIASYILHRVHLLLLTLKVRNQTMKGVCLPVNPLSFAQLVKVFMIFDLLSINCASIRCIGIWSRGGGPTIAVLHSVTRSQLCTLDYLL